MAYPTLEQYNEALQHPQTAFFDSELKMGNVSTTGLGLPLALCGGFALTYSLQCAGKKYAVRCFHKQSNLIESRYKAISNKIGQLRSPYFVHFEFQNTGIKVSGQTAPIVKMMWASGETLGEFIEGNYRKRDKLSSLRNSLQSLARFLEEKGIAHGDIQPGNVMVSNGGQTIQLIDYDGMYVDDIKSLGGAELGHRNFQHPKRNEQVWNAQLDRFSFIELHLALSVLEVHPDFWGQTKSDGDSILFKATTLPPLVPLHCLAISQEYRSFQLTLKISQLSANPLLTKYQHLKISLPKGTSPKFKSPYLPNARRHLSNISVLTLCWMQTITGFACSMSVIVWSSWVKWLKLKKARHVAGSHMCLSILALGKDKLLKFQFGLKDWQH